VSAGLRRAAPLLAAPRYEVLPAASTEQAVLEWVPKSITLTVTASPVRGLEPTLALAERLAGHGYTVVPHLSARLVRDAAELAEIVARLRAAGIEDVFVPGGDADPPAGCFDSALSLLRELAELGRPFRRVGITGYPQSHPKIADDITVQAMWDKRQHAAYLVSNLCFDPVVLARWIARVRARGVTLPLQVGLAGPIDRTRLLRMAAVAGVRESARFASGHADWLLRLGTPGGYRPDRLLGRAGAALAAPAAGVEGLHIFTFNQLRQTEQWRQLLLARWAGPPAGAAAAEAPPAHDAARPAEGDHPAAGDGGQAAGGGTPSAGAGGRAAGEGARSATG
jgi:methylenetetrahydrofolate reductase (NADPH)